MYNEKDIISKWNSEMYDCNETDTNDVEFALSVIGVESKRILEIACGSGRFLVPMANAGHNVTGLDFDEHMLNRIATKTASTQNIHWHKSDVINDEWETGFDVVLLVANFLSNIVSDMDYEQAQELMIKKSKVMFNLTKRQLICFGLAEVLYYEPDYKNVTQKLLYEDISYDYFLLGTL